MASFISLASVTVANGATAVTTSQNLEGIVFEGDMLVDLAQPLVPPQRVAVDAVGSGFTLAVGWPGTSLADDPAEVRFTSDAVRQSERTRELLEQLSVVQANGRGLFYRFDDATADADPGSGNLRLNNSAPGSATAAYLDNLDANGATVSAELDTWGEGTGPTKGRLWLRAVSDPSAFHSYDVTAAVVDGTGYRKLTLDYVGGSGSFADGDELMVAFAAIGDQGSGYEYGAEAADSSELAPFETEAPGYKVWLDDLGTDFGAYAGRGGVVRLIAGPAWEVVAVYTGPQGIQGEQGEQGEQGVQGERGITWRDDYSALTAYVTDDGVLDNGSSWRALQATTGNAPPVLPTTSNAYWVLVAAKGTDGTGTGDVVGPASAVANRLAAFDGTTGKLLKDSGLLLSEVATETYVDDAVGSIVGFPDSDRRNQLLIAAGVAKALAGYQRLLDGFADGYKASDGIAAGSSSNYTVDTTAGCVKPTTGSPTLIADGTGTAIGGNGGATNPGNAFDNNDATYANNAVDFNDAWVGKNWGGVSHTIGRFIIKSPTGRSFSGGTTGDINWDLDGSNNGSAWTTIDTGVVSDVLGAQVTVDRTVSNLATGYTYHRVRIYRGSVAGWRIAEVDFYDAGTVQSMTVVTTLQTADAARTKGRVLLEVDDVTGGATINTDLTAEFSCNNQANYAVGTLTLAGLGQNGRKVYETEELTCTSGSVLSARIKTANAKDIRVYKAAWKAAA